MPSIAACMSCTLPGDHVADSCGNRSKTKGAMVPQCPTACHRDSLADYALLPLTAQAARPSTYLCWQWSLHSCRCGLVLLLHALFCWRDDVLLPIEVRLRLELCQHCLLIARSPLTTIHIEHMGGRMDVRLGVVVALGQHLPIWGSISEDHCDCWHLHSCIRMVLARSHIQCTPL